MSYMEFKEPSSSHKSEISRSSSWTDRALILSKDNRKNLHSKKKNQILTLTNQNKLDFVEMDHKLATFHEAILNNDIDKVREMLDYGIDPNAEEAFSHKVPLIEATKRGYVYIVQALISAQADVNKCNIQGTTALHICMSPTSMNTDIIRLFLDNRNTNFNVQDKISDSTPLHVLTRAFCSNKNTSHQKIKNILRDLVPRCNLHLKDTWGNTALHIVAKSRKDDVEVVEILLSGKPDVNSRNFLGETPLSIAINYGNFRTALAILNCDVDTGLRDRFECTLLHYAAKKNACAIVKRLLDKGSDVNAQDPNGDTALHIAAGRGYTECVSILLKHPEIEINKQNLGGYTPLMCSVDSSFTRIVKILLDAGCDVHAKSLKSNKTALDIVEERMIKKNKMDIYKLLLRES
ncbi:putative ankyrin repeat protein RF_0381 [Centruroides vittatus]|uniref:putative ankyrin repeat protein RF_0381 n=1 Tax=Centruroides vittatus TaxID=120091 RepID=UPI00350FAA39